LWSIIRQRDKLDIDPEESNFVRASVHHRYIVRTVFIGSVVILAVLSYPLWQKYSEHQYRKFLSVINLPDDLLEYQVQLRSMTIQRPITDLEWQGRLETLTIASNALAAR
jgi:hypothetical protein